MIRFIQKVKFVLYGILLVLTISATYAYSCEAMGGFLMEEATIIVWDEKTQTEHFIRRATFEDIEGRSVGFIVPTPSVPKLAEADEDVLFHLDRLMQPETVTRKLPDISLSSWLVPSWKIPLIWTPEPMSNEAAAADAAMPAIEVLQQQRIGDLDATTVRATDAKTLNRWLAKHGYSSSPEFEAWLNIYVQKGWVVTAFKFAHNTNSRELTSPMIRMSFKADHPFYPYREPQKKEAASGRTLRIYLFANGRMQAAPGNFGEKKNWPGEVEWSDNIQNHSTRLQKFDPSISKQLGLPKELFQQAYWMTVFNDFSSPRPAIDDITFIPATDKSTLPDPIVEYKRTETKIPVEAILLVIVVAGVFIKTRRGKSNSVEE